MRPAIRVDNLSKSYRLGQHGESRYRTLRESLTGAAGGIWNGLKRVGSRVVGKGRGAELADAGQFWALKNVSFELQPGEVLGIVGRNGAGKSTLLKILSRITEPTSGRAEVRGRMGSLLEVGTGFHPELTGRENIYLNGSVLGMSRREIAQKFDEIVAFSEIEQFLDTPVKRYSSGMYVRLAFAVAAHLEPEILVVDEVLAVGDVAFQKKCLGKMKDVARQGRTICFVSHNMPAVLQLCNRAVYLQGGELVQDGPTSDVVQQYLAAGRDAQPSVCVFADKKRPPWANLRAELMACRMLSGTPEDPWSMPYKRALRLEIRVRVQKSLDYLELGLALHDSKGAEIASSLSCDALPLEPIAPGLYTFVVSHPNLVLAPGQYMLGFGLRSERDMEDYISEAVWFHVLPTTESSENKIQLRRGVVIPALECELTVG